MKVKVCGMTTPENLQAVAGLQPDMLGFIFFPLSPRHAFDLAPEALEGLPASIQRVGVFVDSPLEELLTIVQNYRLNMVQLHGSESPGYVASVAGFLPVIKAFPVAIVEDLNRTDAYEGLCEYFLFDTAGPKRGGNGLPFDWSILQAYRGATPFLLAGGIGPKHASQLANINHPKFAGVDLNSRFESEPGIKQIPVLSNFLQSLNAASCLR